MEELNVTYLTFDGHVDLKKYRYLYFTIVFVVYVLILCSNSTIVYLIWKHQDLHEPMYIFIAALLFNSVLFTTNIVLGVVILVNTVFFPVIFVIFSYTRILIICYHSCGEVRRKAAQTCLPHLLVLINYFFLITYDVITVRLEADFPKTVRLSMTLQLVLYNPLFNPLIYGLKMKEISKHLKKLFCQEK